MRIVFRGLIVTLAALALVAAAADVSFAQRGRGGPGGRGGFGFGGPGGPGGGGGGGGITQLLQDENVRKELDLVDEQVSKLTEIGNSLREELDAQRQGFDFSSLRDLSDEQRTAKFAEIRQQSEKITSAAQKKIEEVLLPPQLERLKQIEVQSRMRFGAEQALTSGPLAEELKITDQQKEKLAKKQEEVQAALQEKIAKLRQEAQEELFSVLDPSQQDELKKKIGKPFTFSAPQGFGGAGGPGGGFGGFGGRGRDGDRGQRNND